MAIVAVTRRRALKAASALAASGVGCGPQVPFVEGGPLSEDERRELLSSIDHFVVLTMENRSFDHMLGSLLMEGRDDIDGLTGDEWSLDLQGNRHYVHRVRRIVNDPLHTHDKVLYTWAEGRNDQFVAVHEAAGYTPREEVMGYHTREDLPALYALADEYTVCDAWFSSVMGPTWPNRLYLHCASSAGNLSNELAIGLPSLFDRLDEADISSRYYYGNLAIPSMYGRTKDVVDVEQFFRDAEGGTLPAFCMVDPALTTGDALSYDDHPPLDFSPGQAFVASVYHALATSPLWPRTLLFLIYDEHGGIYDHVPPPKVVDERAEFRRLGFRVPALLIGPTVRRGHALSEVLEHVSVHATINRRFDLEPLTERAARAADVADAIDPEMVASPRDPIALPAIDVVEPPPGFRPGPGVGQEELRELFDRGGYPRRFDLRPREAELREAWMKRAIAAGLVRSRRRESPPIA